MNEQVRLALSFHFPFSHLPAHLQLSCRLTCIVAFERKHGQLAQHVAADGFGMVPGSVSDIALRAAHRLEYESLAHSLGAAQPPCSRFARLIDGAAFA